MKRLAVVAFTSLAVVSLAACSKYDVASKEPTSTTSTAPRFSPTPPPASHVSGTLHLIGEPDTALAITLVQIIDPATGVDGPPTDAIGHPKGNYVAAMVTITNTGKYAFEDDANNDAELVGSNHQDYTPALSPVTECTNFDNGAYRLEPGESVTGCVAFAMPPGVHPIEFKFAPASGFAGNFGEWLIP